MLIALLPDSLHAEQEPEVHWWRLERDSAILDSGCATLGSLRQRFPQEKMRALVPPDAVTLYRVTIPVRRPSAVRAALPFALEDQVSQELEDLHFVAGPRRPDDRFAAAVVEHQAMQIWQKLFLDSGWRLEAMTPLSSVHAELPEPGVIRLQVSPWPARVEEVIVTARDQEPAFLETSLLPFWLNRRLAERGEGERSVELIGLRADELDLPADVQVTELSADPKALQLQVLQRLASQKPDLNLLSGPYSVGMATPPWKRMRPMLVAAGVVIAVLLAQLATEWIILANERDRLYLAIDRQFDTALPNSRRVDPVAQFRQALEGGGNAAAQQGMGTLLYEVLAVSRAGGKAQIRQFRANQNEVEVELHLPSFAELEAIRGKLAGRPGLRETLQGADSGAEGVTARLKIERSGS
jgi:general secretion pathway protein L